MAAFNQTRFNSTHFNSGSFLETLSAEVGLTTPAIIRSQGKFRTLIAEIGLAVPAFALIFKPPRRISRGLGTDRVRGGNI